MGRLRMVLQGNGEVEAGGEGFKGYVEDGEVG